jgi:hypothetical protein
MQFLSKKFREKLIFGIGITASVMLNSCGNDIPPRIDVRSLNIELAKLERMQEEMNQNPPKPGQEELRGYRQNSIRVIIEKIKITRKLLLQEPLTTEEAQKIERPYVIPHWNSKAGMFGGMVGDWIGPEGKPQTGSSKNKIDISTLKNFKIGGLDRTFVDEQDLVAQMRHLKTIINPLTLEKQNNGLTPEALQTLETARQSCSLMLGKFNEHNGDLKISAEISENLWRAVR